MYFLKKKIFLLRGVNLVKKKYSKFCAENFFVLQIFLPLMYSTTKFFQL